MKKKYIILSASLLIAVILLELIFPTSRLSPDRTSPFKHDFDSIYNQQIKIPSVNTVFEKNDYSALNYDAPVGVWISYIELSQMLKNSTEDSFRNEISNSYDKISSLGANTVYVHVRAFSDAYYFSEYYPLTSAFGDSEPFDALQIMIEEAHKRNLSFHAWINPLRCQSEKNTLEISKEYAVRRMYDVSFGEKIVAVESSPFLWLNPAYKDVQALVYNGVGEIVSKYDVDAIHIDDYFYPTISDSFDKSAFEQSGQSDLSDWRMSNIDNLVLSINAQIKNINPSVLFEISPQGNISNNYTQMYADVKKWCKNDNVFCDVIIPQVYFGYNSSSPYLETINAWSEMTKENDSIKLVIGLGVYKISEESEFMNTENIISKQISDALSLENVDGISLYGYSVLFDEDELAEKMESEREAIKIVLK